jgi:hypothetical protein
MISLHLQTPNRLEKRSAFDNPAIPLVQVGWDVLHGGFGTDAGENVTQTLPLVWQPSVVALT